MDKPKRHLIKRVTGLGGDLVDSALQKAEGRGSVGKHLEDGVRLEEGDANALKGETIEVVAERKRLEREYEATRKRLGELLDLKEAAEASGDRVALAQIADRFETLALRFEDIQEQLDGVEAEEASVKAQRNEQNERAERARADAERRARQFEHDKRKVERIERRMGLGEGDDVTRRNLQKAIDRSDRLRDRRAALEELETDPGQRSARRGLGETAEDADIRALRDRLGVGRGDPSERIRRAIRGLNDAQDRREASRGLGEGDDTGSVPAADAEPADLGDAEVEADVETGAGVPAPADPAPARPERAERPAHRAPRPAAPSEAPDAGGLQ